MMASFCFFVFMDLAFVPIHIERKNHPFPNIKNEAYVRLITRSKALIITRLRPTPIALNYPPGCQSTGSHYNPLHMTHGAPQDKIR